MSAAAETRTARKVISYRSPGSRPLGSMAGALVRAGFVTYPCFHKQKRSYASRATAERGLAHLGGEVRDRHPCATYLCDCGSWHLTSRPEVAAQA